MRDILHIINGYSGNRLYRNLVSTLDALGIRQLVYIPVRPGQVRPRFLNADLKNTQYTFSKVLGSQTERLFFFRKIRKIVGDIENHENFSPSMLVHAHSLFSDGGAAWHLHRKHRMNYLVAVRNTDVNFYFKYFFFLRRFGERILMGAGKVIFLSPAYRDRVLKRCVRPGNREIIAGKSIVIPNGTDSFWQDHPFSRHEADTMSFKLIYVGEIRRNKNLHNTIKAVGILRKRGLDAKLTVIGYGLNDEKGYASKIREISHLAGFVESVDHIQDQEVLLDRYRQADIFVMPSFTETFGLVYAEAMTQGLPVIYSKGQGIDGYFKDGEAGYPVNPNDPEDIADKVIQVLNNYDEISGFCTSRSGLFSWTSIGKTYQSLYEL